MEFLDLPTGFLEKDLRKGLIGGMKQFMLEIGKDFTFVDEEYAITVGGEDFRIFCFIIEPYDALSPWN